MACKKFVEIEPPNDRINTEAVFSDSANATKAIIGIYASLNEGFAQLLNGGITLYTGLAGDELKPINTSSVEEQFYYNSISPQNNYVNAGFWKRGYQTIYQTNAAIEGLKVSSSIKNDVKQKLTGEAKLIRALTYFYLTNIYGQVPLITSTDYEVNLSLPRSSIESIYNLIIQDCLDARESLGETSLTGSKLRANKFAAIALLARSYLYQGQWQLAEKYSQEIISNSSYLLENDLSRVFQSPTETIWQIQTINVGFETSEGFTFIPGNGFSPPEDLVPSYNLSGHLLDAFEVGDNRLSTWAKKNEINGQSYFYPFKYKLAYTGWTTSPQEHLTVFRAGEQYLIRAEARAYLSNPSGAVSDLNTIRRRAKLTDYSGPDTQDALVSAILHERQVELFCEWGHRWLDLKRTNKITEVLTQVSIDKGSQWDANWQWFPVPSSEIQTNPYLKQNTGYSR